MSDPVVANVIHTGAILWTAPEGEAYPDETTIDFGDAWGGNWVRMGYTKAPLAMAYEDELALIKVQEVLAAINARRIDEALAWETELAELTAEYLQRAAGNQTAISTTGAGAGQDAYEETGLGGVTIVAPRAWGVEGLFYNASGESQPVRMFIHRGVAKINGKMEFSKRASGDNTPGIPIHIEALADVTQSAGYELTKWQRVTSEKTS